MKLIISRQKWLRGKGPSFILNNKGKMCCLGFLGLACGYEEKDILLKQRPDELNDVSKWPEQLLNDFGSIPLNSDLCFMLMHINDDVILTDEVRENLLKGRFKKIGIDVEFVEE